MKKMQKGCWKMGINDEVCFIDVEKDEDDDDPYREYSNWCDLPDLLLEQIFSYLNIRERYYASLVCRNWYRAFHLPPVWSNFIVDDRTLTRPKYNYYSGWQYCLDHLRTQNCLSRVGRYIKGLDFRPQHSFNNIYQFMTLLSWCIDRSQDEKAISELKGVGGKIKSLVYVFPCNMSQTEDPTGIKLFGTGGQLLAALKNLMKKLKKLKILKLIDLVLERYEANHLLDEVLNSCCLVLRVLYLVNVTICHCPIMHVGLFLNLQVLVISPQNIDDDILCLLADTKLKHLHLLQNKYTPPAIKIHPCSIKAWRNFKSTNPTLKVHIEVESSRSAEFVFQPEAPVYSILYNTPTTKISSDLISQIIDNYKDTLSIYGHKLLPKFISPKSFGSRVDSLLLLLARQCCNLNALIIREKISTSTVLLLAYTAKHLCKFYVRRNAVIIRCDWSKSPEWSEEFYSWLKSSSRSYELVEKEVSHLMGRRWTFSDDKSFKKIDMNVRNLS